jgi:hypothetical protein
MKKSLFALLSISLLLTSCEEPVDNFENAAAYVGSIWKAESTTITRTKGLSTSDSEVNNIELEMDNLTFVEPEYSHEKVTSVSALLFIKSLSKEELGGFVDLIIRVSDEGTNYEKTYKIDEIQEANIQLMAVDSFFDFYKTRNEVGFKRVMDDTEISDSIAGLVYNTMLAIDSAYGVINNLTVTGFTFSEMDDIPVIKAWIDVENGGYLTRYVLGIARTNGKVVYVGMNEAQE